MTVESDDSCADNEATLARMNTFLDDALRSSCEGIMVKSLDIDAGYTPSKRTNAWLKVKRDYVEGLSDSLDLVPLGAWYGNRCLMMERLRLPRRLRDSIICLDLVQVLLTFSLAR
ncbi:PREDICTED: DNA ligase 6-like isoform X1 [Nicotiana attenuata]|uniref:Dna ligase 6 n=2 Tax=Nicotiana attenuata TaxID=49451 RepID=A0A1J6K6V1_NICAT|nr:PREDICTED: DNA ligase 6-like isoform X1 [Nicotiana attenuata]OIT18619.1 dna ligase 6 [Nicotiana attenuata]